MHFILFNTCLKTYTYRSHGYKRLYLPLYKVADTPFHIQGDGLRSQQHKGFSFCHQYKMCDLFTWFSQLITLAACRGL